MTFKVRLSFSAELDLQEAIEFIAKDSKTHAKNWVVEFQKKIESLRELPLRHALIPESNEVELPLRSITHYSHRIIYLVDESSKTVEIVRVYHGARKPLDKDIL
jgi:toxin ParE1/3/4